MSQLESATRRLLNAYSRNTCIWSACLTLAAGLFAAAPVSAQRSERATLDITAYVIDADGNSRVVLDDDPGPDTADASSFSNLLASEVTTVMHS